MKSIIFEIRNTIDEVSINLDIAEEGIIELEDRSEKKKIISRLKHGEKKGWKKRKPKTKK